MPIGIPTLRLTQLPALAVLLAVLVMALLGPSQTLAQARKVACSPSATHTKAGRRARVCVRSSHKGKAHHATKRDAKHAVDKKAPKASSPAPATVAAYCEDGSAPVRAGDGSFSCADGSEPECEGGATPRPSRNGKRLVCPVATEGEAGSSEAECEAEEALGCSLDTSSGADEQACEASANDGSSSVCETESEG